MAVTNVADRLAGQSITLHGAADSDSQGKGQSSALLLKLDNSILQQLKAAAKEKDGLRFSTGNTPKLRIGSRIIDLTISPDAFRNELFASTSEAARDLYFTSVISHQIELKNVRQSMGTASGGTDAALAALQNSLASYEQEKQAKQTNITTSILPPPKSRFEAARREKLGKRGQLAPTPNGSLPASPALGPRGSAQASIAATLNPIGEDGIRWQAMKTPLLHLLAIKPSSSETLASKTNIPHQDVLELLQKYGRHIDGKWQLTDRAYRELEVWKFKYPSKDSRQAAIDGAIKAFDRLRIGKEDNLWQLLLPKSERGQGKVLSRLHLGNGPSQNRGLTPTYQDSPMPHVEGVDSKPASAANTPRLGASTPRPGSSKGDVMKRLLSKDPAKARKAREIEAAKERKRKEREAAASDREANGRPSKKQATQKATANVKSAEFVQSSDEESSGEVGVASRPQEGEPISKPKAKDRSTAVTSTSPDSSDEVVKAKTAKTSATHSRTASTNSMKTKSPALKASQPKPAGKATPQTSQSLSAPASQHKSQRSPQKHDSRPNVPSPLGAARPRLASDVSERSAVGVQRVKVNGESTPRGLGISNGITKVKDETSAGPGPATTSASQKTSGKSIGTPKLSPSNPDSKVSSGITKRKADAPKENTQHPSKHRKTESTSSLSHSSTNNGSGNYSSGTSPSDPLSGSSATSSDSTTAPLREISYAQGTNIAQSFRDTYYPAYVKLYDEQSAMEARGEKVPEADRDRLLRMHRRLEQMKEEIARGSRAGG